MKKTSGILLLLSLLAHNPEARADSGSAPFVGLALGSNYQNLSVSADLNSGQGIEAKNFGTKTNSLGLVGGWRWYWPQASVAIRADYLNFDDTSTVKVDFQQGSAEFVLRPENSLYLGLDLGWRPSEASLLYMSLGRASFKQDWRLSYTHQAQMNIEGSEDFSGPVLGIGIGAALSEKMMLALDVRREFYNDTRIETNASDFQLATSMDRIHLVLARSF